LFGRSCDGFSWPSISNASYRRNDKDRAAKSRRKLAVRVVEALVTAWNKNDTETLVKLFLPDAVLILPSGSAIRKRIMDERRGRLKDTILHHVVEDVSLDSGNMTVVQGKYRLDGMKVLAIMTSPEGSFVLRQKKPQGQWMISRAELTRNKND
jgi:ketosteroid isomerase-like protein